MLAASLLAVVRGFSNIPPRLPGRREWRGADRAKLENVIELARKTRRWDRSALDVTCGVGLAALAAVLAGIAGVGYLLWRSDEEWLMAAWVVDAGVLLLPHWVTGVRRVLTNDPLVVKVTQLLAVMDFFRKLRREGEQMTPQMQVRTGKQGEMPCDAKLVLQIATLGEDFPGLQTQVVLNRVQGRDYPYLYCVLVARPQLEMLRQLAPDPPKDVLVEPKREADVDIMVIRRRTTKTSGYHTPPATCRKIFAFALAEARRLAPAGPRE